MTAAAQGVVAERRTTVRGLRRGLGAHRDIALSTSLPWRRSLPYRVADLSATSSSGPVARDALTIGEAVIVSCCGQPLDSVALGQTRQALRRVASSLYAHGLLRMLDQIAAGTRHVRATTTDKYHLAVCALLSGRDAHARSLLDGARGVMMPPARQAAWEIAVHAAAGQDGALQAIASKAHVLRVAARRANLSDADAQTISDVATLAGEALWRCARDRAAAR